MLLATDLCALEAVPAGAETAAVEPPPAGLLEFLGMMVDADGELIGPLEMAVPADDELSRPLPGGAGQEDDS